MDNALPVSQGGDVGEVGSDVLEVIDEMKQRGRKEQEIHEIIVR